MDEGALLDAVITMVKARPAAKPPCPPALVSWEAAAHPNEERRQLDEKWRAAEVQAALELGALVKGGVYFIARQSSKPSSVRGIAQRKKKPAAPSSTDMAVVGAEFEEDGTTWVVHDVRYEELADASGRDVSCVIVLYYEEGDNEAAGDEDAMEWSTVAEVKKWIRASST